MQAKDKLNLIIAELKQPYLLLDWLKMQVILYGIPNCDQIRKARNFLGAKKMPFLEVNFKKEALERTWLLEVIEQIPLDQLINKRGTSYRKLNVKELNLSKEALIDLIIENPSLIKRPLINYQGQYYNSLKALEERLAKCSLQV